MEGRLWSHVAQDRIDVADITTTGVQDVMSFAMSETVRCDALIQAD